MSENRKFIAFFSWVTLIFLVLTYVFSIQNFEYPYINNGFLETVFGGLFASFGVMLLAEIKKYYINKKNMEDLLYFTMLNIYNELVLETKYADLYITHPSTEVPSNVFSERVPAYCGYMNTLRGIDYATYGKSCILCRWNWYRSKELPNLNKHVNWCSNRLFIAVTQEKLNAQYQGKGAYNPVSSDHDVNVTLHKMKADALERIKAINPLMSTISSVYPDRYQWEKDKTISNDAIIRLPSEDPELNAFFKD